MPKSAQVGRYFVVGGPVQPDRPCYIERAADQRLLQAIAEERFAYVLSPRSTGKSSLMASTIRRLRAKGQLAAVVDLTQIGSRAEGTDAGRWYYSIAYRIVRELRLKIELQAWWQDRSALAAEQRLVEFFGDIVVANTSAPVTIFFDEADRATELPFATELFVALRSCYMRRVSEPEFSRLNFVVLGVGSPESLCPDASLSPFSDGVAIQLADFTGEQARQLAPGFDRDEQQAIGIVDAIVGWTGGHPYLTQKVARAVARRGADVAGVDAVVDELLLAPSRLDQEPLFAQIRGELEGQDKVTRQARTALARLADGAPMASDFTTAGRALLDRIGMLRQRDDGSFVYRNVIFENVFGSRFVGAGKADNWHRPAALAAVVLLIAAVPFWYLQILPQPYISTLTVVSQDFAVAQEAYSRLSRLPGFGDRADRLLTDAMARRSQQSSLLEDVMMADAIMRRLPENESLADRMLAGFWLRRASGAMNEGDRDAALLYALAAGQGEPDASRRLAAELISDDYRFLAASYPAIGPTSGWEVDWEGDQLILLDESRRIRRLALEARSDAARAAPARVPGRMTAVQHVEVERELSVEADGTAGVFTLRLTTQHDRASDLIVRLTSPSGARVEFALPQPRADQQALMFIARRGSPLAALSDEEVRGVWLLNVLDVRTGEQGVLTTWGLQFPGSDRLWEDRPQQGVALPDPLRTEQVELVLDSGGGAAVAVPSRSGVRGAMSIWDLGAGTLRADLEITRVPEHVDLLDGGARLISVTDNAAALWDVDQRRVLFESESVNAPAVLPVSSPDQGLVAVATDVREGLTEISVVETATGAVRSTAEIRSEVFDWALGANGDYVAVVDGSRWLRLFDPESGSRLGDVIHDRPLDRLAQLTLADLVVAVDVDGAVLAWPVDRDDQGPALGDTHFLGTTTDPTSVIVAEETGRVVFVGRPNHVEVRQIDAGRVGAVALRQTQARRLRLSPDGETLVVEGDARLRRWRLDAVALRPAEAAGPSALGLDRAGSVAAIGYRGGHLRISGLGGSAGRAEPASRIDYIGHRGAVTSAAISVASGIAASGGADGVVRIWDLATVAPNDYFLRHPEGPIRSLALSADGASIASGAEYSARIWALQSGELSAEIPVDGTVQAIAFAPSGALVAVGDSAGNVFLGSPRGGEALRSLRMPASISAIAFAPDSARLATADRDGNLTIWDVSATERPLATTTLAEAVRWISFGEATDRITVATEDWLQALVRVEESDSLQVTGTRLLGTDIGSAAAFARVGETVAAAAAAAGGASILSLSVDAPTSSDAAAVAAAGAALPHREWSRILGLELDSSTGDVRRVAQ